MVVGNIVDASVNDYIAFFNKSIPITTRLHQLELLPGIGKKHMWKIIEERRYEPFKDFDDLKSRVELLPNPRQAIIKRIVEELDDTDKYNLFTS
jgi:putative nucleotide binding protein